MNAAQIKSVVALHNYAQEVALRRPEDDPRVRRLHTAKRVVWMILLAGAFLCYYLMDRMSEALALL